MNIRPGDKIILNRDWAEGPFSSTVRKGTVGVIVKEHSGMFSQSTYDVKFEGFSKTMNMNHNVIKDIATVL